VVPVVHIVDQILQHAAEEIMRRAITATEGVPVRGMQILDQIQPPMLTAGNRAFRLTGM
jgi:hypothetical protein